MLTHFARAALISVALIASGCGGASSEPDTKTVNPATDVKPEAGADEKSERSDITLGRADAPVTLIEYASPTCPHCATFHETVFPEIKSKYIDTGLVKLIFREIPTPPANMALVGSLLGRCAAEKNGDEAYFIVLGTLFKTGHGPDPAKTWIYGEDKLGAILKIAGQAGMDKAEFEACLKRKDIIDLITANSEEANEKYNVTGTPNFVINGKLTTARTADEFGKAFEEARAAAAKL